MKAIFTDKNGNTQQKEIPFPPKPTMFLAGPVDPTEFIYLPDGSNGFDMLKPQTFSQVRYQLLGVDDEIAYYTEAGENDQMKAQLKSLTAAFIMKHPEIDSSFQKEMAAAIEKSPPLGEVSLQEYLHWVYNKVRDARSEMEMKSKIAKPPPNLLITQPSAGKFSNILKEMGLDPSFMGEAKVPFATTTQAVPHDWASFHAVTGFTPSASPFVNAGGHDVVLPEPTKITKPKVVAPKKPPIVPPPKGRMIVKRKG